MLTPQGVPSLHPARNATIFNFVFPVIWVSLSRCSSSPLPLMGKRKRSLGFISPATRAINKRGERGAPRLYMGEKKVLIFSPPQLRGVSAGLRSPPPYFLRLLPPPLRDGPPHPHSGTRRRSEELKVRSARVEVAPGCGRTGAAPVSDSRRSGTAAAPRAPPRDGNGFRNPTGKAPPLGPGPGVGAGAGVGPGPGGQAAGWSTAGPGAGALLGRAG